MAPDVRFDRYRFDSRTGRLWSGTEEVHLTPKAAGVLSTLLTHAGEPVTKEHLFASVWPDAAVGDDALTTCILELRKALHDDARQPRFIETRHRRGYRFIASISPVAPASTPAVQQPIPSISTIAVLPFADMSPNRDHDYLCEGLADELISALTNIETLRVAARTASFQFRQIGADVQDVGQRLGVDALLEGSVRKANDRLRVTVQLIEVATGYQRWSKRFEGRLDDVFAIQDEIAETVATSLRGGALTSREQQALRRAPTGAGAYEYYLRGRQHLAHMTQQDLESSAEYFRRALVVDPTYGPAVAGLATVHATLFEWFGAKEADLAEAERASVRALELAPDLAEAHVARGCALALSRRYDEAALEFENAIRLNANLFDAYYYYGRSRFGAGDISRSAELFAQAGAVRQEDFQSVLLCAQSLRVLGRTTDAQQSLREGLLRAERALQLNADDLRALSLGSVNLFYDGQVTRALEWSKRSLELSSDAVILLHASLLHALLGNKEPALDLLERAFAQGWGKRDWIAHDPDYDSLRDEPRFRKLLAELK